MATARCACGRDIDIGPLEGSFRVTCAACLPPEGLEFPIETQSELKGDSIEIAKLPLYVLMIIGVFTGLKLPDAVVGVLLGVAAIFALILLSRCSSGRVEVHHDFLRVTPRIGFTRAWMWEGLGFVRAHEKSGVPGLCLELGLPGSREVAQTFRDSRLTPKEARRIVRAVSQTRASCAAYVLTQG